MKVFYSPKQSVSSDIVLPSPSASKPAILVERWSKKFPVEICNFEPVTREDFYLAHDKDFINAILDNQQENGFYTINPEVTKTFYWTTGSFYAAALEAVKSKKTTCSPTSGFHHSKYDMAGGFCTFNGLMVTALKLLKQFPNLKIGILDCDHHYGDGTDDILKRNLHHNYTWAPIAHYTFGGAEKGKLHWDWKGGKEALDWLNRLENILYHTFKDCNLILYQAGADPHAEDGGALTTAQLSARDDIVFDHFSQLKIPVVWNLAGGYLTPLERVLEIHDNTMMQALTYMGRYNNENS